jgi:hypothetical protein
MTTLAHNSSCETAGPSHVLPRACSRIGRMRSCDVLDGFNVCTPEAVIDSA